MLCMDQLGDVRKKGCGHCVRVHSKLARDVLATDLGDMVLVPKEALAWLFGEGPDADGHWFEPPEIKEGERKKPYWWRSRFRAMLSAAQGDADDQGRGSRPRR